MTMRAWILALALGCLSFFQFGQSSSAAAIAQRGLDLVDGRPARSILILGNSRTFFNDMPAMLRQISDSAGSPVKLQIESNARPGYRLQDHLSDRRSQRLLQYGWDEILIQGESNAQSSYETAEAFQAAGARLAPLAQARSRQTTLLVAWPYDPSIYIDFPEYDRTAHLIFNQSVHANLARTSRLPRLDLAGVWESVRLSHPHIKLTSDGNHPTVAGTYLYALAVYRHVSRSPAADVRFSPEGLPATDATALRRAVDAFAGLSA